MLDWALWNASRHYVDPERIDPKAMTLAGIEALEDAIPEVLVEPLDAGKRVRVRVGTAEREFQVGDVEALWAVGPHVREVFRFVVENTTLDAASQRDAEYAVVAEVLATLDPHTNLLRPEDFEDMRASTKGSFGGLGIEVGTRDGGLTVIRVLDGNPASKVDMRPGDRIVQIDEVSTVTMTLTDAVQLLRGAPGTTVKVYILREGLEKPKPLEITRAIIQLPSVVGTVVSHDDRQGKSHKIGVLQIPRNFAQTTPRELRDKLEEFTAQKVEGVVLDLRGNPGGLLNAAVAVADAFLSAGTIVATVGANAEREESSADSRYDFPDVPLAVLVDQRAASASEIVAGALRNLDRAVVLGRRTFGKGSVQVLHERKMGDKELALKLTIAQYLIPGDQSIQSVGVAPDVETVPVYLTDDYLAYYGRERFDLYREESLTAHLEGGVRAQRSPFGPLYFLAEGPSSNDKKKAPDSSDEADSANDEAETLMEDPEIRAAADFVVWAPSSNRTELLERMPEFLSQQGEAEEQRISTGLEKLGVDWSEGPRPTSGSPLLQVSIRSDKPGNVIKGGETGTVTVRVTNDGNAPAFRVRAITDSDYRYFDERELFFGRIDPGQSKEAVVKLSVGEHELSRTDRIDFHLFEQHGANQTPGSQASIDISAQGLPRPQFAYGYQIIDHPRFGSQIEGNGDGALQVGERVKLRVEVKNIGEGPALETWVTLRNRSDEAVFLHTGRARLKDMQPGDSRVAELDLELRGVPDDSLATVQLSVSDNKLAEVLSEKLRFPVVDHTIDFTKGTTTVTMKEASELLASPGGPRRVVARVDKGAVFPVTGTSDGWLRLSLGKDLFAFAHERDTEARAAAPKQPSKFERVLEVSPPTITIVNGVTQTDQKEVHLSGVAADDQAVRDIYITVANPSRDLFGRQQKVFYQAAASPKDGRLEFAADIPLTPGNNFVQIHARENDEVVGVKTMWVLRTSGLTEARAKERELASNGHKVTKPAGPAGESAPQ